MRAKVVVAETLIEKNLTINSAIIMIIALAINMPITFLLQSEAIIIKHNQTDVVSTDKLSLKKNPELTPGSIYFLLL